MMNKSNPRVSIIMPCRNEVGHIEECLNSILALEQPEGGMEVVIADGMSDDGTRDILTRMVAENPVFRVIDNPAKMTASGLNAAIRIARGEIIVRMDAHTEYASDYVVECVRILLETGADNVGGPARTKAIGYVQRAIAAAYHTPCVVGGARFHNKDFSGWVDTVTYGCWPKASFDKFGLFDEDLVRNQDDEHNLRINRMGGRIWQSASIKSWYHPRSSLYSLFRQYFQYGYWKVRVIQKNHLPSSLRHLMPVIFVFSVMVLGICGLISRHCLLLFGCDLLAYGLFVSVATFLAAQKGGWSLLPVLPVVIATYQVSYGFGFLMGILDFVLLRRSGQYKKMNR